MYIPGFLLLLLLLATLAASLTVNKCCPFGYEINLRTFLCEKTEVDYSGSEEMNVTLDNAFSDREVANVTFSDSVTLDVSWFPLDALLEYNASILQPASDVKRQEVVGWLKEPGIVQAGNFEFTSKKCQYSKFVKSRFELFYIVVAQQRELKLLPSVPLDDVTLDDTWMLPIEESCLDFFPDKGLFVLFYCPGPSKPWIQKCCQRGHVLDAALDPADCVPTPPGLGGTDWRPNNMSGLLGEHFVNTPIRSGFPNCAELTGCKNCTLKMLQSPERAYKCRGFRVDQSVHFLESGAIKVDNDDTTWEPEFYCGDRSWHEGGYIYANNIFHCPKPVEVPVFKILYGILFIAGGVCLLLTVAICLYLPELRRRIHNKIAITHNAALMVAHFLWGTSLFRPSLGVAMCSALCLAIQFTFLGSLFWLNAMCVNISSTFRNTQTISGQSMRSESRRYGMYSLYAWGLTALVSIFTVSMEFAEKTPYGLPRPGFSCYCDFARDTSSVFVYFYAPMAIVLIVNLVLYIFTTWKIMSVQRETKILQSKSSSATGGAVSQNDKQRLIMYTKLFLLMGLTWSTEIIGWAVGATDGSFWMILDVINLLRAVFIFILFVCKRPVLRSLRDRLKRLPRSSESSVWKTTEDISLSTTVGTSRRFSQLQKVMFWRKRTEKESEGKY